MLIELYIFFEIVLILIFLMAFFTKQEILWGVSLVLSGALTLAGSNIQYYLYEYSSATSSYVAVLTSSSNPALFGINLLFFSLSAILMLFDIFDKYSNKNQVSRTTFKGDNK